MPRIWPRAGSAFAEASIEDDAVVVVGDLGLVTELDRTVDAALSDPCTARTANSHAVVSATAKHAAPAKAAPTVGNRTLRRPIAFDSGPASSREGISVS